MNQRNMNIQLSVFIYGFYWIPCINNIFTSSNTLFAIILTTCFPSIPKDLWEKHKDFMSEDILHRLRAASGNNEMQFTPEIYNEASISLEDQCLAIVN